MDCRHGAYTVDTESAAISMRNKYLGIGGAIAAFVWYYVFLQPGYRKNIKRAVVITDKLATAIPIRK